jgi:hypothetical protein
MSEIMTHEARCKIISVLSPKEREMLDTLLNGDIVPTSRATRVRACRIRYALNLYSPSTILICARGRGYTMRKLEA